MRKRVFYNDDSLIKPSQEHVSVDVLIRAKVGYGAIGRKYSGPVYDGFHVHADDKKCVDRVNSVLKSTKMLGLSATTEKVVVSPSKGEDSVMKLRVSPAFVEEVYSPQKDEESVEKMRMPPTAIVKFL